MVTATDIVTVAGPIRHALTSTLPETLRGDMQLEKLLELALVAFSRSSLESCLRVKQLHQQVHITLSHT